MVVPPRNVKPTKEKSISSIYLELHRYAQNGEYDRALRAANRILQTAPQEELAFKCKIVCLIHQAKFHEAIQHLNKNEAFSKNLNFEKAYCYYRMNLSDKALETIEKDEGDDIRLMELRAQIHYRLEHFNEALNMYKEIIKNSNDDYADERETNLLATIAQLNDSKAASLVKFRKTTYELVYNWACISIANQNYAEAEKQLKLAEKIGNHLMTEDGLIGEEIDVELSIIRVQLAYVYQKLKRIKEAQELYGSAFRLKLDDPALVAAASNNTVVINKDQNMFDSKKKMKAALSDAAVNKLTSHQKKTIMLNNIILTYYTNQFDQCRKLCATFESNYPKELLKVRMINAFCFARSDRHSEALRLLDSTTCNNPTETLYKDLIRVHISLMGNNLEKACDILENLGENSYRPGVVGALITFYLGMKKTDRALSLFPKTVEYYRQNKKKEWDLSAMWRKAANFQIRNGQADVAVTSLEELVRSNPTDKKALAQLVMSYAQTDKTKMIPYDNQLPGFKVPPVSDLVNLENINWINLKKHGTKIEPSPRTPGQDTGEKKQRSRKRRSKLPKNYNAQMTPDPERWLPKYEKTGYRKKRDRRFKDVIKGSQGTSSNQADQFDFTKVGDASPVEQSPQPKSTKKTAQKKKSKRR